MKTRTLIMDHREYKKDIMHKTTIHEVRPDSNFVPNSEVSVNDILTV
jgi:hypothetical protein